jgi:tRNA uridine 5-carboxymethylaminomethyl modification enzyme
VAHVRAAAGIDPGNDPAYDSFIECEVKYRGYIDRQDRAVRTVQDLETHRIPGDFCYAGIAGLSAEARQKLIEKRPETVGQASRIDGVRAADLSILMVRLEVHRHARRAAG